MIEFLSFALFGPNNGTNLLTLDWDHLIVLDACRCDVFAYIYKWFFPLNAKFKCLTSLGSSTMEVIRRSVEKTMQLVEDKLKNTIFINANPVIDHTLGTKTLQGMFYKYVPVWRKYWNNTLGTVEPIDVYRVTLRIFIRNPDKNFMVWFLQPHYPYISKKFYYINTLDLDFMNKSLFSGYDKHNKLPMFIKIVINMLRRGYLCAGIPDKLCIYARNSITEVMKAYIVNALIALHYAKKLTEILPGKIVITSDHGEAFGETLKKLLPIRVYGHPSRIRIPPLTQVPYMEIENTLPLHEAIRSALKELTTSSLHRHSSAKESANP